MPVASAWHELLLSACPACSSLLDVLFTFSRYSFAQSPAYICRHQRMPSSPAGSFNAREQRRPTSLGFGLRRVTDLRTVRPTKTVTFSDQHDRLLASIAEHARWQPLIETSPSASDHTPFTNQSGASGLTSLSHWTVADQHPVTQITRPSPDNLEAKRTMPGEGGLTA